MALLECGMPLSGTSTAQCSAADAACALEILSCAVEPAWEILDYDPCNPEAAFFQSTICEYTDLSGFPIEVRVYIPKHERLWGEDPTATLADPMISKAVFEPSEETSILNVWGIVADDTMQYIIIPKSMWRRDIGPIYTTTPSLTARPVQPMVGDVIKTIFNDRTYEVTDVGDEQAIFMGQKFAWELIVRPYRFSEEDDEHRDAHLGVYDDPFETIVDHPSGGIAPEQIAQNNYATETFGDNEYVEEESNKIDDYNDVYDPDKGAFGV